MLSIPLLPSFKSEILTLSCILSHNSLSLHIVFDLRIHEDGHPIINYLEEIGAPDEGTTSPDEV